MIDKLEYELLEMLFDQSFALVSAQTKTQAGLKGDRLYELCAEELWFASEKVHAGTRIWFPVQPSKRPTKTQARDLSKFLDGPWSEYRRDGELPFVVAYDVDKVLESISAELGRYGLPPVTNPGIELREVSQLLWPGEPDDLATLLGRCGYVDEGQIPVEVQHQITVHTLRVIERKVRDA